jgi:hypothetical protein
MVERRPAFKQFFIKPRPGSIARRTPLRSKSPNAGELLPTSRTYIELNETVTTRPKRMIYSAQESGYLNRSRYTTAQKRIDSVNSTDSTVYQFENAVNFGAPRSTAPARPDGNSSLKTPSLDFLAETPPNLPTKNRPRKKVSSCSSSLQRAKTAGTLSQTAFELEKSFNSAKPHSAIDENISKASLEGLIKVATLRQRESRQLTGAGKRFQQQHESRTPRHETQINASEFRLTQENFTPLDGEYTSIMIKRSTPRTPKASPERLFSSRPNIPYLLYHNGGEISGIPKGWQSNVGDETQYSKGHLGYCNANNAPDLTCSWYPIFILISQ